MGLLDEFTGWVIWMDLLDEFTGWVTWFVGFVS
jgi:hypothetical protein